MTRNADERDAAEVDAAEGDTADLYRDMVEHSDDMLYMLDADGTYRFVNSTFCEVTGYDREEIIGNDPSLVLSGAAVEEGNRRVRQLLRSGDRESETWRADLLTRDGGRYPVEIRYRLKFTADGEYDGLVGAARDVHERTYREQQLDVLTRVLRHNFRNQLNVILGESQLIRERNDDREIEQRAGKISEVAARLLQTSEKARAVRQDVLDSPSGTQVSDVVELTRQELASYRDAYPNATVDLDAPEGAYARISGAYTTALSELVENALEHCPSERDPVVAVDVAVQDVTVTVTVTDNSEPIPDAEIEVIRRGGEQALSHGTGLGLWLVNWIVRSAGGELTFDREDGGNAVRMHLPTPGTAPDVGRAD